MPETELPCKRDVGLLLTLKIRVRPKSKKASDGHQGCGKQGQLKSTELSSLKFIQKRMAGSTPMCPPIPFIANHFQIRLFADLPPFFKKKWCQLLPKLHFIGNCWLSSRKGWTLIWVMFVLNAWHAVNTFNLAVNYSDGKKNSNTVCLVKIIVYQKE